MNLTDPRRFTIQERAARFQRRYTGPWQTVNKEVGSVTISTRYRRRPRTEFVELWVARHDLWIHAVWRQTIMPIRRLIARWLDRLP
jgi:hypothetical protein